jgi:hypothetical protein
MLLLLVVESALLSSSTLRLKVGTTGFNLAASQIFDRPRRVRENA